MFVNIIYRGQGYATQRIYMKIMGFCRHAALITIVMTLIIPTTTTKSYTVSGQCWRSASKCFFDSADGSEWPVGVCSKRCICEGFTTGRCYQRLTYPGRIKCYECRCSHKTRGLKELTLSCTAWIYPELYEVYRRRIFA